MRRAASETKGGAIPRSVSVDRALAKIKAGKSPNAQEARALEAYRRRIEKKRVLEAFHAVGKKAFCEMARRQQVQIDEQARTYDIPMGGPSIDLYAVLPRLFDMLGRYGRLSQRVGEPGQERSGGTPAAERKAMAQALFTEFKLEEAQGKWVKRSDLLAALREMSGALRRGGEMIEMRSPICGQVFRDALDAAEKAILRRFKVRQSELEAGAGDGDDGEMETDAA